MKVVVTGASGFLGREIVQVLAETQGTTVVAASRGAGRDAPSPEAGAIVYVASPDLEDTSALKRFDDLVTGADCVVHLAALTPASIGKSPQTQFETANVTASEQLARSCAKKGVSKFVFLSSLGINGATTASEPLTEDSPAAPHDAYSRSKLAAEQAIRKVGAETGLASVIIRAPMIYGPGARGPVALLARAVVKGVPLPFGAVTANARDMIGVRNMAEFVARCVASPAANTQTFVVRDGYPVSTRQLIETIAREAGTSARLVNVPPGALRAAGTLTGRGDMVRRLIGDYRIDDAKARRLMAWEAPHPLGFDMGRLVRSLKS